MVDKLDDGTYQHHTWHIIINLLPTLEDLRKQGKLTADQTQKISYRHKEWDYCGETNSSTNLAHGIGKFNGDGFTITSTFVNDLVEGVCITKFDTDAVYITEYKAGEPFGKKTLYMDHGRIINQLWEHGTLKWSDPKTKPEHAFYSRDGKMMNATKRLE